MGKIIVSTFGLAISRHPTLTDRAILSAAFNQRLSGLRAEPSQIRTVEHDNRMPAFTTLSWLPLQPPPPKAKATSSDAARDAGRARAGCGRERGGDVRCDVYVW